MGTAIIKLEVADAHDHLRYPTYYVAYMWVNIFLLPGLGNLESSSCLSGPDEGWKAFNYPLNVRFELLSGLN